MDIPPAPGGDSRPECVNHPGTDAVARCVSCHRAVCAFCRVVIGNRNYCRSCVATTFRPPDQVQQQPFMGGPPPPWGYPPPPGAQLPVDYYGRGLPQVPGVRYRVPREVVFPGAPWGVGEALIIFAISFLFGSGLSFLFYELLKQWVSGTAATFLLIFLSSVILYTLLLAGTFYSVKVRHGSTITALGLKIDGMGKGLAWGAGLGLPLFLVAIGLAYLSQQVFRNTNTPDMVSRSVNKVSSGSVGAGLILLLVMTLVVLAPACEEIFFRGYLYPALRNRMDLFPAMLINGLLFAAAHFELVGFLPRAVLGFGLCYIYERQHNLAGAIMGHAIYNGLILAFSGLFHLF